MLISVCVHRQLGWCDVEPLERLTLNTDASIDALLEQIHGIRVDAFAYELETHSPKRCGSAASVAVTGWKN